MKAKLVKESLEFVSQDELDFQRGIDSKRSLNIGAERIRDKEELIELSNIAGEEWKKLVSGVNKEEFDELLKEADSMGFVQMEADQNAPVPIDLWLPPLTWLQDGINYYLAFTENDNISSAIENLDIETLEYTYGEEEEENYDMETYEDPLSELLKRSIDNHESFIKWIRSK